MARLPDAQLTHIGLYVHDMQKMVAFYTHTLGMQVSDSGTHTGRELTFLTRNPGEHHQLVLARIAGHPHTGSNVNQLSFRLATLEDLRAYHAFLAESGVRGLEGRDHGNAWSLYFFDPEDNKIEMYVPTPWHVSQPWRAPLDLNMSAAAIDAQTRERLKEVPSARPAAEWSAEMSRRIAGA